MCSFDRLLTFGTSPIKVHFRCQGRSDISPNDRFEPSQGGPSGAGHWHGHPILDGVTSLAPVQDVIDFTHSTRAMLITVDPAPSRLRLPRTWGLGFAISGATRVSMSPADGRTVVTKRTDVAVRIVTGPGRGNTDVYELRPGWRRYRSQFPPAHRRAVCFQSAG